MHNIYLVGFMGTGKTSIGRDLAKRKKWRFVDLDSVIEAKEGKEISLIFSQDGEPYFRTVEKETLKGISCEDNIIVACGGGIVLDKENIQIMKATGTSICLSSSVDEILERTRRFKNRPLLDVPDPRERIESLLKQRAPFYSLADKTIDTSGLSVSEVAEKIMRAL